MGGNAMSIVARMKKRRADFSATLARGPGVNAFEELLKLYWADANDLADIVFDNLEAVGIGPEPLEAEKKCAVETVRTVARNELGQLAPLLADEARDFDMIVTAIIDRAFEARLAERRRDALLGPLVGPAREPKSGWRNVNQRWTADR
jgi:hypothetical protein